jgi:hypothetical protein
MEETSCGSKQSTRLVAQLMMMELHVHRLGITSKETRKARTFFCIVTYQDSPVTQQLNGASLLYSLVSATMKTNASSLQ